MADTIEKSSSAYDRCIQLCLDRELNNCANRCGAEKLDSFSLNPFSYIDTSSRAFKQAILTSVNPYSIGGLFGIDAIAEILFKMGRYPDSRYLFPY